jgi:Flp pilus assembly protein TadG
VTGPERSTEDGAAVVEFVFVAIVVLVPLLYLVLAASALQRNALAVTQAAREAGRAFATADDETAGQERAAYAVQVALADQGLDGGGLDGGGLDGGSDGGGAALRWVEPGAGCAGAPVTPTLEPGAEFAVCVVRTFRLPAVPGYLAGGGNTVSGVFTVHVDDFRSRR